MLKVIYLLAMVYVHFRQRIERVRLILDSVEDGEFDSWTQGAPQQRG